jgi:hypothetical protein
MTPFYRRRLREKGRADRRAALGGGGRVSEGQMSDMCLWPASNHGDDLLSEAIADVRPLLIDDSRSTKERIRLLWAAAKNAGELAATDVQCTTPSWHWLSRWA